jgi:hypothetical protein
MLLALLLLLLLLALALALLLLLALALLLLALSLLALPAALAPGKMPVPGGTANPSRSASKLRTGSRPRRMHHRGSMLSRASASAPGPSLLPPLPLPRAAALEGVLRHLGLGVAR